MRRALPWASIKKKHSVPQHAVEPQNLRAVRVLLVLHLAWCLRCIAAHSFVTMPVVSQSQIAARDMGSSHGPVLFDTH